jgi:hypothetical protein
MYNHATYSIIFDAFGKFFRPSITFYPIGLRIDFSLALPRP